MASGSYADQMSGALGLLRDEEAVGSNPATPTLFLHVTALVGSLLAS